MSDKHAFVIVVGIVAFISLVTSLTEPLTPDVRIHDIQAYQNNTLYTFKIRPQNETALPVAIYPYVITEVQPNGYAIPVIPRIWIKNGANLLDISSMSSASPNARMLINLNDTPPDELGIDGVSYQFSKFPVAKLMGTENATILLTNPFTAENHEGKPFDLEILVSDNASGIIMVGNTTLEFDNTRK